EDEGEFGSEDRPDRPVCGQRDVLPDIRLRLGLDYEHRDERQRCHQHDRLKAVDYTPGIKLLPHVAVFFDPSPRLPPTGRARRASVTTRSTRRKSIAPPR